MSEKNYSNEKKGLNPIIILLGILFLATLLTYIVDSGVYERDGNMVVANSYNIIDKDKSLSNLFNYQDADLVKAEPVSIIGTFMAIPSGLEQGSGLIFMVLIIGGMFGILTKAGTIDAGLERLLSLVQGNIYVLVILLMIVFSAGTTFLGLASEYLLISPLMVGMANRLALPNIIGFAIVCVAVKAGYLSSVTNPLPLTIAQPLLGLQIFSGASVRFFFYLAFLAVGIGFVLFMIKRQGFKNEQVHFHSEKLSTRHVIILLTLTSGIALLVYASTQWHWKHHALSAYYIALSMVLAAISGLSANQAAQAFVDGMKKVLLASILIGVATAVAVVLKQGMVLDSIVHFLMSFIGEGNAYFAATGMFVSQLMLDFLIPSTSGQAAVSMPILGPIGNLAGVSEQTTIVAFLFGNGITNILTPTSGTLLAYLATARVGWGEWAKFIFPLWLIYIVLAIVFLQVSVFINF